MGLYKNSSKERVCCKIGFCKMQSNINAAKIVVFLDFGGVSKLLQMLIFLKCELCDRP